MRLVFAGTPDAAVPSLRALVRAGHDVALVITRPDAPQGRRRLLTPSPVAAAAEDLGLRVHRAARLDAGALDAVHAAAPELGVIVAYGGIVREPLLSTPDGGWINLHFSLLPRWRGAAPVQHAIIAGDAEVGVAVFRLTPGLDEGDVYAQTRRERPPTASAGELLSVLAAEGSELLVDVVGAIADGTAVAQPQSGEPTFAPKLDDLDGLIDWTGSCEAVIQRILGVTPEPGAHTSIAGARLKVLGVGPAPADAPAQSPGTVRVHEKDVLVGTGSSPLALHRVQPAGKPPMNAGDWWRGVRAETLQLDLPTPFGSEDPA